MIMMVFPKLKSPMTCLIITLMLVSTFASAGWSGSPKNGKNVGHGNGTVSGNAYILDSSGEYGNWDLSTTTVSDIDCVFAKLKVNYDTDRPISGANQNPPTLKVRDASTGLWGYSGTMPQELNGHVTKTYSSSDLGYIHPSSNGMEVQIETASGEYADIVWLEGGWDYDTTTPAHPSGFNVLYATPNGWVEGDEAWIATPGANTPSCKVQRWEVAVTSTTSSPSSGSQLGGTPANSANSYTFTIPGATNSCKQNQYVWLRYYNYANVYSAWKEYGPYNFDDQAPSASQLTSWSGSQWTNSNGQVSWQSGDYSCSGVDTQTLRLSESSTVLLENTYQTPSSGNHPTNDNGDVSAYFTSSSTCMDGEYDLRLTVDDVAGKQTQTYGVVKFDNCQPEKSSFNPLDDWYNSDSVTIGWSTSEDCPSSEECAGGVEYVVNDQNNFLTYSGSSVSNTFSSIPDGEHTILLDVCDAVDNCQTTTDTDSTILRVDTTSPTMSLPTASSISDWSNDPNFWVEVSADDISSANKVSGVATQHLLMSTSSTVGKADLNWVEYSCLDSFGLGQEVCSSQQRSYDMSSLGSGVYRAFVYATDVAGNEQVIQSNSQQLYKFDFDEPHGSLDPVVNNVLSNNYLESSTASLSWSAASDSQPGLEVSGIHGYAIGINEMPTNPQVEVVGANTVQHSLSGFQNGENFVCVAAIDFAGNVGDWACSDPFQYDATQFDTDGDGISDASDNCPSVNNPNQNDADEDGVGDVCEEDTDADGLIDDDDNCPTTPNSDQADNDLDGVGDACDDSDGDDVVDADDNCPTDANSGQEDADGDGTGDACDDSDGDGILDAVDNCPFVSNGNQGDEDENGIGDACEGMIDRDGDGIEDDQDNCPDVANADQADTDNDGEGDACETEQDTDADGVLDESDNCPFIPNANQADADADGVGDACENSENSPPSKVDVKSPVDGTHMAYENLNQESVEWWSANDDDTIVRYALRFNEGDWRYHDDMQSLSFDFPALEAGTTNRLQIYAIDSFGLQGETSSVTFVVCDVDELPKEDRTSCESTQSPADSRTEQSLLSSIIGLLAYMAVIAVTIIVVRKWWEE